MFCTTSKNEDEVVHVKLVKANPPSNSLLTVPRLVVVLLWFYFACFWYQSFGDVSLYVCSYYFSSVSVAEWPPFGK